MSNELFRDEGLEIEYNTAFNAFVGRNKLVRVALPDLEKALCFPEGEENLNKLCKGEFPFLSPEAPLNLEKASRLFDPNFLATHFRLCNYDITPPLSIVNQKGSTLFVCAGVQVLDGVIHREDNLPLGKLFVAQPVVRTQFMDQVEEGISTCFINIATEIVNPSPEAHFESLDDWLVLLSQLGFQRSEFFFLLTSKERKWGSKKFRSEDFRIRYAGISLGTAMYIHDVSQENRPCIQISDIGLGLERIRWILSGGKYLDKLVENETLSALDPQLIDYCRSLALLSGSGVKPSNNDQGYRFRKFSKALVSRDILFHHDTYPLLDCFYDYWASWTDMVVPKSEAIHEIEKENERNFNRELIDRLGQKFSDVGVDINLPTSEVIKLLRGTSASKDEVEKILEELRGY